MSLISITEQGAEQSSRVETPGTQWLLPSGMFLGKPTQTPSKPTKGAEAASVISK